MTGLSAKVFRTYNASFTMATLLRDMKSEGSMMERIKDYNDANRKVAILCNHKRTIGAAHATQMEKMTDKVCARWCLAEIVFVANGWSQINGLKYQKWRIKQMMLSIDPKIKKKKGADFFLLDEDIDHEWVLSHQAFLVEEQRQKIQKKFEKENEKLVAEGSKEMKAKELTERMEVADELEQKFKRENKTKKVEVEGKGATIEKMMDNLAKLDQRIENMKLQAADKEDNKEVALATSKIVRATLSYHLVTVRALCWRGCTASSPCPRHRIPQVPIQYNPTDTEPTELHRSSSYCCLLEEVQRPHREVIRQDSTGEVRLGNQVCG